MNFISLAEAQTAQPRTKLQGKLLELDKRQIRVATELEIGPFLVDFLLDPIDYLLHLLILDVGFDDATGADAFGISENFSTSLQDIVHGSDIFRRASDQLVLEPGESARNGFSFDGFVARSLDGKGAALGHARQDSRHGGQNEEDVWLCKIEVLVLDEIRKKFSCNPVESASVREIRQSWAFLGSARTTASAP